MNLNRPKTPFLRSPRLRILALLAFLFMPACAATQKPEPAKASSPAHDPFGRNSVVDQRCKGLIKIFEKLHIQGKDVRQFMSEEDVEKLVDCYNLKDAESELKNQKRKIQQKRGDE